MAVLGVHGLTLAFGSEQPLLDDVGFQIEAGERIALLGRNGSGKSTLMKVLAGELEADGGEITSSPGTRITRLAQEVPQDLSGEVFEVVASGLQGVGELLAEYHHLSQQLGEAGASEKGASDKELAQLERLQQRMEAAGAWHQEQRVETVISRLQLPSDERFETLSGGLKRRVLMARALVAEPDLLLLDEPTNHLDIPAIAWLEELLAGYSGSLVFVTHDRAFLRSLSTRILELDRGRLSDWPGDYQRYLDGKQHQLDVEAEQNARFDKKLAQEEAWIRQGIKARRTRNEGRVRALQRLREERRQRRAVSGQARLRMEEGGRSGKRVIEVKDLSFAYGDRPVIRTLSTQILRGDKVGILGPNGSGKTTLLRLLLGQLEAQSGNVQHGTKLEVAYFDQHREQLDDERSVAHNLADGNDKVVVGGRPRHVISYLQDFLFAPDQVRSPVKSLSGGERNRLLLARLFTRPCNLLVMDEPTNDLDVETLELLEALLVEFDGTLLLVSHDRAFLDNVVTSTLVMEGGGRVGEYAGGYSDWLVQRPQPGQPGGKAVNRKKSKAKAAPTPRPAANAKPRRLSYKEKQELEALPARIEALESEQGELHQKLADPGIYRTGGSTVAEAKDRLQSVESELAEAYQRWEELESRA